MISAISSMSNRIEELEKKLSELQSENVKDYSIQNCVCINKNFSNLEITNQKRILIATLKLKKESALFFQGSITIFAEQPEEVEISLLCGGTVIQKQERNLIVGENNISIFCNFIPIFTEKLYIYLKITPKNLNTIYLRNVSIFVLGMLKDEVEPSYQAIEIQDKVLLAFTYLNSLYYLFADKNKNEFTQDDFETIDDTLSFSFVYDDYKNITYLFRINDKGDLFFNQMGKPEKLILENVSYVSSIIQNETLHIFYIKNGNAFHSKISSDGLVFAPENITPNSLKYKKIYSYYNKTENKIYIVLSNEQNSNYLLIQTEEDKMITDSLPVSYKITFQTYGVT